MPSERSGGQQEKGEAKPEPIASLPAGARLEERPRRLQRVNRQQMILRAVDVEKLIAPDHTARAIWELVGRLDLSGFTTAIESVEGEAGRPAYDPQLLISLWIYAYSEGVSSAREVARRCEYHPAYQWLTGWEVVNHHSLSDFRVEHQAALDELFAQVLGVLSADGLITLERVMHDGTKVKAQASGKSFRGERTLREHLKRARERVRAMGDPRQEPMSERQAKAQERAARERLERLEQALEQMQKVQTASQRQQERRVSETDPEARFMKQSGGGYAPSHNVQVSTDAAHSLIVGVSVIQSANDEGQLLPALKEVQRNLGRLPRQVVADAGFTTRETILEMAERQIDFIGGTVEAGKRSQPRPGVDPAFRAAAFAYEAERDIYRCPAGKELLHRGVQAKRVGVLHHVYHAREADCRGCVFRKQCCAGNSPRRIWRAQDAPAVEAFKAKMQTATAQAIYRLRAAVAEFPHAWLKAKIGLRQFRVRGLKKVRCEALWACLAYNLAQWVRLRWRVQPVLA
ncbi:MAG TPA: IS1182 family transposase, partial [Bryobacteraceae bacterium]|nr:IS1182 family transposase [Bryobacteraceae bacterium]